MVTEEIKGKKEARDEGTEKILKKLKNEGEETKH